MSLISVNNLTFDYDGSYNKIFEDVTFNIDTNWKLGFNRKKWQRKNHILKVITRKI